jgi:multiple antibiotic resistance protein
MAHDFFLAFIPIFVAVDAIGVLPIYVSLTQGVKKEERPTIIVQSVITALCLAIGFIFLGKALFRLLGITLSDFMVAGGILLFIIAIIDLINPSKRRRVPSRDLGAVPLGTPLIVGPAVLTTSLLMIDVHGVAATLVSVIVNVFLAGVIFSLSDLLLRVLGEGGTRALSKVTSLLLAAIAVMLVRKGLVSFFVI